MVCIVISKCCIKNIYVLPLYALLDLARDLRILEMYMYYWSLVVCVTKINENRESYDMISIDKIQTEYIVDLHQI